MVVVLAAAGLPGLELRVDGGTLVPEDDPAVRIDRDVRQRFGVRDPLAIVVSGTTEGAALDPRALRFVESVTAAWHAVDTVGPEHVTSLATEKNFRMRDDSLRFRGLLEPPPETPEAVARLRDDLDRIGLYQGTLVAEDASATVILVGTPPGVDRGAFAERARAIVAEHPLPGYRVDVLGAPVAEALLGVHVLDDLGVPRSVLGAMAATGRPRWHPGMVPVALLITSLVLLVALRRPLLVAVTLGLVGACLLAVLGVMGWLGLPIYLTLAVMPVLLTALGVADAIHVLMRVQNPPDGTESSVPERVRASLDELAAPVIRTSWTTAAALLSFAVSPLVPVRAFGLCTALGVLLLMVAALTTLPAALCLLPARWIARPRRLDGPAALTHAVTRVGLAARRRRVVVWIAVAAVVVVAADGVRRVRVHDSWLDGFAPDSTFARATERFESRFFGAHRLLVEVRFPAWRWTTFVDAADVDYHALRPTLPTRWPAGLPRDAERLVGARARVSERAPAAARHARDPREWQSWIESAGFETIDDTTRLVATLPRFEGSPKFWLAPRPGDTLDVELWAEPLQVPEILRRVAELERFAAEQPGVGGVLGPARYLETTAFMTDPDTPGSRHLPDDPDAARRLWHNYGVVRGPTRLGRLVTPERERALLTVFLRDSNSTDTGRLIDVLERFAAERLAPVDGSLSFAGDVAVSQALIGAVVRTQTRSLALSLAAILATAALLLRSWRLGLLCVGPSALVVWLDFALMGWLGIPLGVATSMFAGMTLGVGVDYSLHLLARHRHAERRGVADPAADALDATGPALVTNALAVGLGFGVLALSQVPGNARLGLLLLASVLGCLAASVFLVPTGWAARDSAERPADSGSDQLLTSR